MAKVLASLSAALAGVISMGCDSAPPRCSSERVITQLLPDVAKTLSDRSNTSNYHPADIVIKRIREVALSDSGMRTCAAEINDQSSGKHIRNVTYAVQRYEDTSGVYVKIENFFNE